MKEGRGLLIQALVEAWGTYEGDTSFWSFMKEMITYETDSDQSTSLEGVYGGQIIAPKQISDAELYGRFQQRIYKAMKDKKPTKPVGTEVKS